MLLLLHAHAVTAAKQILEYDSPGMSFTVTYIAKTVVNSHLLLPKCADGAEASDDGHCLC